LTINVKGDGANLAGVIVQVGTQQQSTNGSGIATFTVQKGQTYAVALTNLPEGYVNKNDSYAVVASPKAQTKNYSLTASKMTLASSVAGTTFKIFDTNNSETIKSGNQTFNIKPGTYRVVATKSGYYVSNPAIGEISANIGEGQTIDYAFTLTAYIIVSGTVKDAITNNGLNAVQLNFNGVENKTVYTSADGTYSVQLKPGAYNITGDAPNGYADSQLNHSANFTINTTVNFSLTPTGTLSGQVVSWNDITLGIVGAKVNLYNESGVKIGSSVTGTNGYFSMSATAGVNMSIEVEQISYGGKDYARTSKSGIRINAGLDTSLGKVFMPLAGNWTDGSLQGKVVHALNGNVIANATVELRIGGANGPIAKLITTGGAQTEINASATTDSVGNFLIGGTSGNLLDGQYYTVVVKAAGFTQAVVEMVLINNATNMGVVSIVPTLTTDEITSGTIKFTLRWKSDGYNYITNQRINSNTRDLDTHFVGPNPSTLHVYYAKKATWVSDVYLDIDDTEDCTRNGETLTVRTNTAARVAGTYSYTVHNYGWYPFGVYSHDTNTHLATKSHAVVTAYDSKGILAQVTIDPNSFTGNGWKVFELVVNADKTYTLRTINTVKHITSVSTGDQFKFVGTVNAESAAIANNIATHPKY
jgi:hypothetical protein